LILSKCIQVAFSSLDTTVVVMVALPESSNRVADGRVSDHSGLIGFCRHAMLDQSVQKKASSTRSKPFDISRLQVSRNESMQCLWIWINSIRWPNSASLELGHGMGLPCKIHRCCHSLALSNSFRWIRDDPGWGTWTFFTENKDVHLSMPFKSLGPRELRSLGAGHWRMPGVPRSCLHTVGSIIAETRGVTQPPPCQLPPWHAWKNWLVKTNIQGHNQVQLQVLHVLSSPRNLFFVPDQLYVSCTARKSSTKKKTRGIVILTIR
jgi:hypothetical protein